MERLTEHFGRYIRIKGLESIYSSEYSKSARLNNAIIKLTAYEDAMPLERVQELAQAEKRGRLVVLPPNAPLTLEELLGMDGEPVWVEFIPSPSEECTGLWALVSIDKEYDEIFLLNSIGGSSSYEEAFADIRAIYRHKPEEGVS